MGIRFFDHSIFTDSGSPIHMIYTPVVNEDGNVDLVESGKENTDDYIQSFKDSCDMEVIIQRFLAGDSSALNKKAAMFGDFTSMPKTYAEVLQLQIDAKKAFDELPVETKEKFDNDINKFLANAGESEWYEKLGVVLEKQEEKKESEEVKE